MEKRQRLGQTIPEEGAVSAFSRRSLFKITAASLLGSTLTGGVPTTSAAPPTPVSLRRRQRPHVAVIGAGVFGGWTALYLRRSGARVTLLDTWGPGNARSSSGGERRMIHRQLYAGGRMFTNTDAYRPLYMEMVTRSIRLWREHEERWQRRLYYRCGSLTLQPDDSANGRDALTYMREWGAEVKEFSLDDLTRRYPQMNLDGVSWGLFDVDSGYLRARYACQEILRGFLEEGGEYRQTTVAAPTINGSGVRSLRLSDGSELLADQFVFACGPWLGQLFPGTVRIRATRQEAFFFGTPSDDHRYTEKHLPICLDETVRPSSAIIPDGEFRGLLTEGGPPRVRIIDPTTEERIPTAELAEAHRKYLAFRFPGMKDAPLLSARVCQYEVSNDRNFIVDRHPEAENLWLIGGGSGHGFKHGPALGERVAATVLGDSPVDPLFGLARFASRR